MKRLFATLLMTLWVSLLGLAAQAQAQGQGHGLSGLARVDAAASLISDTWGGGLDLDLALSQGVPYRAYTLQHPARLVLDFREVDWSGLDKAPLLKPEAIKDLRFGAVRPGWSRLVADLAAPQLIDTVAMSVDAETGRARLHLQMTPASAEDFAARSGAPHDPRWDLPPVGSPAKSLARPEGGDLVVVIDPGHGGIDPGAERDGYQEKHLMLTFARELQDSLRRAGGFEVHLTREDDHFVSLERRVAIAHERGAHVFLSLHADALAEGGAHGATLHLLSEEASDAASAKLAERHDRDDILSGVDLTGQDDVVADVLLDLARQETKPRARRLAESLRRGLQEAGAPMNRRPLRHAGFSVLKAADIPSVLIEIGFMSSQRDLDNIANKQWRVVMAAGIRDALRAWMQEDAALSKLVRQ